jgi:hypothetical protein
MDTYLGPLDQITTNAGKNFISKEFNQYATAISTKVKIVPIKAHNSIGIVKRYYKPIRRAYTIITAKIPDISKDIALQMAFKAINDTIGLNSLVPTLLVYSAYLQITKHNPLSLLVTKRALAIKKAIAEMQKLKAKRQVNDALNARNRPSITIVHELALNSKVLV